MRLLLASLLLLSTVSCRIVNEDEPNVTTDCKLMTPNKMWNACITRTEGSKNKDVLFFLHGATGTQTHWVKKWKGVRDVWRERGFDPPAVVTINFGPTWFMAEKNSSPYSGLFKFYLETLIPWTETELGYKAERKLLLGESMGGFNAAQYYFKRPDVFAKVAIVCPAFTLWGPQSSKEEVQDYIKRNNANEGRVKWLRAGLKAFFPKPADWANGDVFQLVDRLTPQEAAVAPPLYLSCGTEDDFGFFEGTSAMAETLSARKVNMIWEPVPGAHCSRPYQQVAEFFMDSKDPETLAANSNE